MIPFLSAAGTSSHVTKMLVELVLCPLTFKGAADGSGINEVRTALKSEIINATFFLLSIEKKIFLILLPILGLALDWTVLAGKI